MTNTVEPDMSRTDYASGWEDACLIMARIIEDIANDYREPGGGAAALFKAAQACRSMSLKPIELAEIMRGRDG